MASREQIRRVLLVDWDPIGIKGVAAAVDEYDQYVEPVARLLAGESPAARIASYLTEIETDMMGLTANKARARRVGEKLTALGRVPG
jgi:hypothetical protein